MVQPLQFQVTSELEMKLPTTDQMSVFFSETFRGATLYSDVSHTVATFAVAFERTSTRGVVQGNPSAEEVPPRASTHDCKEGSHRKADRALSASSPCCADDGDVRDVPDPGAQAAVVAPLALAHLLVEPRPITHFTF